jgi:hypothetical protein
VHQRIEENTHQKYRVDRKAKPFCEALIQLRTFIDLHGTVMPGFAVEVTRSVGSRLLRFVATDLLPWSRLRMNLRPTVIR